MSQTNAVIVPDEVVMNKIYMVRDQKVMLDSDLAELYGVETKVLKQAVRRNITRFPEDFMFEMNKEELDSLRSQIVTSNEGCGGTRYMPFCFSELCKALHNSVKTIGAYFTLLPCFKVPFWLLEKEYSSGVSSNIKSSGKRSIFRLTCLLSCLVSTS